MSPKKNKPNITSNPDSSHVSGSGVISYPSPQVHEKTSCDLTVVPENEPLDSDPEAEQNLVERIKSIKQEKYDLFFNKRVGLKATEKTQNVLFFILKY